MKTLKELHESTMICENTFYYRQDGVLNEWIDYVEKEYNKKPITILGEKYKLKWSDRSDPIAMEFRLKPVGEYHRTVGSLFIIEIIVDDTCEVTYRKKFKANPAIHTLLKFRHKLISPLKADAKSFVKDIPFDKIIKKMEKVLESEKKVLQGGLDAWLLAL